MVSPTPGLAGGGTGDGQPTPAPEGPRGEVHGDHHHPHPPATGDRVGRPTSEAHQRPGCRADVKQDRGYGTISLAARRDGPAAVAALHGCLILVRGGSQSRGWTARATTNSTSRLCDATERKCRREEVGTNPPGPRSRPLGNVPGVDQGRPARLGPPAATDLKRPHVPDGPSGRAMRKEGDSAPQPPSPPRRLGGSCLTEQDRTTAPHLAGRQ
jgi:hypothetical protein